MAIIIAKDFIEDDKETPKKNTAAHSTYSVGNDGGNGHERVFQINMYGSDKREDKYPFDKHKSQIIQINREMAVKLIALLKETFEL